jgi:MoaA/NifB/PqqE/SkfB family radical SAM enzyme
MTPSPGPLTPQPPSDGGAPVYRLNLHLHEELLKPTPRSSLEPSNGAQGLPEAVFPQRPDLVGDVPFDDPRTPDDPYRRHWTWDKIVHAMRGWAVPYVKSRVLPGDFHPIIAYLFTEWKCNLDCHYCWAFDNRVKGMTESTARRSIDWLHSTTCRVLAFMGGEPLLRPPLVHKITAYAAKKGFWIYLPTNGRLLRPDVIDRLGDAGVSVFNLAIDSVDLKPSLPKALAPIRSYFEYLVKKQYSYGYSMFININICRNNLEDVKQLTEIAHDNGISTDYHINESPLLEQPHFKHLDENSTFICPEDFPMVDDTIDWLIEKNRSGYKMVNSVLRLTEMKAFMRGALQEWNCRAGQNTLIIRVDGTLAPCFPMYSATHDWGTIEHHKFDKTQLDEMKTSCQSHCFSTLNHTVGHCYDDGRAIRYVLKQAKRGFQGLSGSFE